MTYGEFRFPPQFKQTPNQAIANATATKLALRRRRRSQRFRGQNHEHVFWVPLASSGLVGRVHRRVGIPKRAEPNQQLARRAATRRHVPEAELFGAVGLHVRAERAKEALHPLVPEELPAQCILYMYMY